jgi:amphi-Trp domain-containing protein
MPEEVLFESEAMHSRSEVADYLRRVADNLDAGDEIALEAGSQSITMTPPDQVEFEVKAEREGSADGDGELSVEFELEWPENDAASGSSGSLEIE